MPETNKSLEGRDRGFRETESDRDQILVSGKMDLKENWSSR